METIGAILTLLPIAVAGYAYGMYPLLLRLMARRAPPQSGSVDFRPMVSVVIPAYNEERQIRGAIEAVLAQDYPRTLLHVLVLSDASTDGTDAIVSEYSDRGVELLRMEKRGGKTAAENAALPRIRGDIVINTDASVRLDPAAIRFLVTAMADPAIGVVSSRDVSTARLDAGNRAEAGYVSYEMRVRELETRAGGIVGASGSGYAIRKQVHARPVRDDLSRDFSAALTAYRMGFRAVSADAALCIVPRTASLRGEYRRKVRTISRGMETLYFNRDLLHPLRHGAFAWKLFSHKICRWLVPISAPIGAVGLLLVSLQHPWTVSVLVAALAGLTLAILGATWPDNRIPPRWLPVGVAGALAANLAVLHSAWRFFHGHEDHLWEPTRREVALTSEPTVRV